MNLGWDWQNWLILNCRHRAVGQATVQANMFFRMIVIRRPVQGLLFDKDEQNQRYTLIATNREERAGKVVFHGGAIWLKVKRSLQRLFADIRGRTWQLTC